MWAGASVRRIRVFTLVHAAHSAPGVPRQKPIFRRETDGRNPSTM